MVLWLEIEDYDTTILSYCFCSYALWAIISFEIEFSYSDHCICQVLLDSGIR